MSMNMHVKQRETMLACLHTLEDSLANCTRTSLYTLLAFLFLAIVGISNLVLRKVQHEICLELIELVSKNINLIRHDIYMGNIYFIYIICIWAMAVLEKIYSAIDEGSNCNIECFKITELTILFEMEIYSMEF